MSMAGVSKVAARPLGLGALLLLVGCASEPALDVVSDNQGSRIRHLVLHFTAEPFDRSLALLTDAEVGAVSAHYLVPA